MEGGGACKRSITDLATSAAERIDSMDLGARGLDTRGLDERGLDERGLDERGLAARGLGARGLGARRLRGPAVFLAAALDVLVEGLGADLRAGFAADLARAAGGSASGGLAPATPGALGFVTGAQIASRVAVTFFLALFAAFLAFLNSLRACLSCAFTRRTCCFAAAALDSAFSAWAWRRCRFAVIFGMAARVVRETRNYEYRQSPRDKPSAPWGSRATRPGSLLSAESPVTSAPT